MQTDGMTDSDELAALARAVIDANEYMTLGTADESGRPWVSPVWFAHEGHRELFWVSRPDTRHSRNLAARPEVAIVIFDSRVPISTGQGAYLTGTAAEVPPAEVDRGLAVFTRRSLTAGGHEWHAVDGGVDIAGAERADRTLRLYRAIASDVFILDPAATTDTRTRVSL